MTKATNDLNAQKVTINNQAETEIENSHAHPARAPDGLLNQETALWHVLAHSKSALVRYLLITVLFLVIDVAVLLVKLSSRHSAYDMATADDARQRLVAAREIGRQTVTGSKNKRMRVLAFDDRSDARRAERQEADSQVHYQAAFYDREAERRRLADEAERAAAKNVYEHQQKMEQMAGEAAYHLYVTKLNFELRTAQARAAHEKSMQGLPWVSTFVPPQPQPNSQPPPPPRSHPPGPPPPGAKAPRPDLAPGDILGGRWQLVRLGLPKGEKATGRRTFVWQARDIRGQYPGNLVAKTTLVTDNPQDRELRARAEADMAITANTHVVSILGKADEGDLLWMVMPYYELGSLRWYMQHSSPKRPLRQVLLAADHILEALASQPRRAHADLKPANVVVESKHVVRRQGLPDFIDLKIRVIDWGVSKLWTVVTSQLDLAVTGTERWRAPEQRRNEPPDPRSDLYALGGIIYWLVTGQQAFAADGLGAEAEVEAYEKRGGVAESLDSAVPGVPRSLAVLVGELMSYEPDNRLRGTQVEKVLEKARDRIGAIYTEVTNIVKTRDEIMVGAFGGFDDTIFVPPAARLASPSTVNE